MALFTHFSLSCVEGKRIPTELRNEEVELRKSMKFDDAEREGEKTRDHFGYCSFGYKKISPTSQI